MPDLISRLPFTKWVFDFLTQELQTDPAIPLGYGAIPKNAGWVGAPGAPGSTFRSYASMIPLTASSNSSSGPFTDAQADWILPYSFGGYSGSAEGPEAVLDRVRIALQGLLKQTHLLGEHTYKVARVHLESLGGLNRVEVDPPFWGQVDTVSFWLMKEN